MSYQSEAQLEQQLIEQLQNQNYNAVSLPDYDALLDNFKEQFEAFNSAKLDGKPLSPKEWERVLNYINGKSIFESAKLLRDKFVLERDDGSKPYLQFLDEDYAKNRYQVTHQTTVVGKYTNRYDVTLLINGLPLVQIELKRRGIDIKEAVNQIMRYRKHSYQGLYHFIQLFVVSNGVDTKYFANSDKDILYSHTFFWTDDNNIRVTNLKDFSVVFLARDLLIKMLTKFTILNDTDKVLMVMRPYQVYATEALIRQATLTNRNAYIWHTTGAGKTLTSFKTAQILASMPNIKKVIFLVDRKDLDTQTTEEFNKFEAGSVDATDRTDILVKQMKDKNRQLIITTIQKMATAVKKPQYAKVMDLYRDEKVVFIIDECHRSQFGDMHKDIVRHFQKAQFFGFTGTPRFEVNGKVEGKVTQTTEKLFGECLHSYLIKDAIFDNNVLGFHIEYITTMKGAYDENDSTMTEAIDVGELYMADERMTMVANHIVQNHKAKTRNRQYTAIFAVSSIPMLVKYYDIFKSIDHDLNISGIFSYGANEDYEGHDEHSRDALERIISDYNKTFSTNFSTDTFSAYHKDISDRMKGKKTKQLDILIVVNMFLTGFDSKPLSVLYVDKDMMYHDLLQAYSRTNRVEKETKPWGIIVCYRNLKQKTDDALALFSQGHPDGILTQSFDFYVQKFNELVAGIRQLAPTPASIDMMYSEDDQKRFVVMFRELTRYLLSLQTFVEFSFDRSNLDLSDQEYQDYKSKYLLLYRKNQTGKEVVSVLDDVDFCIELMESNRINVAYIMNLIRNIDFTTKQTRERDIEHIKSELDRSDNLHLHKKIDILRAFLDQVVSGFDGTEDIDVEYNDFENKQKAEEIEAFAEQEGVDAKMLKGEIAEFEFTGVLNPGEIRDNITEPMPLLRKRSLVNRIVDFIYSHVDKYSSN
ncbi:type I restriction endonuclease subunit R [Neglecta sp. X4]|uniref:type I restriction endonuclease subunit R n=1 Tax=unclassified Neglectibacter TaxID=2632164 RepID=UPI001370AF8E|nr:MULTISPECIES: type I restriction endonuclease subunit R [unclassified Neglectibacter]NBI16624.1 type I restriction endonuclease subunit R [Neglectibacter sp. 59]NBJ74244.1 type I restriction endonuclease subunit R [Neglectibacter sp. X4]NCE82511.1 type I restriction endonuclease subunit R [Neglectibacter sp. X58]